MCCSKRLAVHDEASTHAVHVYIPGSQLEIMTICWCISFGERERKIHKDPAGNWTRDLPVTSWTLLPLSHWTHGRGVEARLHIHCSSHARGLSQLQLSFSFSQLETLPTFETISCVVYIKECESLWLFGCCARWQSTGGSSQELFVWFPVTAGFLFSLFCLITANCL